MTDVDEGSGTYLVEIIESDLEWKPAPMPNPLVRKSKTVTNKGFKVEKEIK
jgi:hypothetical protein